MNSDDFSDLLAEAYSQTTEYDQDSEVFVDVTFNGKVVRARVHGVRAVGANIFIEGEAL